MSNQKFKRGNLVEVLQGHVVWSNKDGFKDIDQKQIGRQAIIEYSYGEKYGGNNYKSYSIIWKDTGGTLAWKHESELKLISKGGEHLIKKTLEQRTKIKERNQDINHIKSLLDNGNLSTDSIIFLFDLFGFESSFNSNGEFYSLIKDWKILHPVFVHIKNSNTLEEAQNIWPKKYRKMYNFKRLYDAFKNS